MTQIDANTEAKRRSREQKNYRSAQSEEEKQAATGDFSPNSPGFAARTFQKMIGAGDVLHIEGVGDYELRPYPMRLLSKAGSITKEIPAYYLAQSLLPHEDDEDSEKIAEKLNQLFNRVPGADDAYDTSAVERERIVVIQSLTAEKIEPALEAIVLAINVAADPKLTVNEMEAIKDAIDHPTMIIGLRQIFELNSGLARRF